MFEATVFRSYLTGEIETARSQERLFTHEVVNHPDSLSYKRDLSRVYGRKLALIQVLDMFDRLCESQTPAPEYDKIVEIDGHTITLPYPYNTIAKYYDHLLAKEEYEGVDDSEALVLDLLRSEIYGRNDRARNKVDLTPEG